MSLVQASQRVARTALLPLRALLFRAVARSLQAEAPRRRIAGIEVVHTADVEDERREEHFRKIEATLELIASYDPKRLSRACRDLERIVIADAKGPEYEHAVRAYYVPAAHLEQQSVAWEALNLVYAATQARLRTAGITGSGSRPRARRARICVAAQLSFARKLPNAENLIEFLEKQRDDNSWWTEQKMRERKERQLRALRAPDWLLRLYRRRL